MLGVFVQTDVFALGVILLQLATGLPAIVLGAHGAAPRLLHNHVRDLLSKGPGPKGDPACVGTWRIRSEAGGSRSDPAPALEDSASGPAGGERPVVDGLIALGLHCTEHNRHMRPSVEEVQLALADLRSTEGGPSAFFALPSRLMLDDKASVSPFYIASGTGSASAGAHGPAAQPQGLRCSSCCEAERDTFFLPCQHAVMCAACAGMLVPPAAPGSARGSRAPGGGALLPSLQQPSSWGSTTSTSSGPHRVFEVLSMGSIGTARGDRSSSGREGSSGAYGADSPDSTMAGVFEAQGASVFSAGDSSPAGPSLSETGAAWIRPTLIATSPAVHHGPLTFGLGPLGKGFFCPLCRARVAGFRPIPENCGLVLVAKPPYA